MNPEELKYYLPDYIRGNLENPQLLALIKKEIEINKDFADEYNSLIKVSEFLNNTKFEEPPEFYFNNLLPGIRQRIDASPLKKLNIFQTFLFPKLKYILHQN